MTILDYRTLSKVYFCSDIHGDFYSFFSNLKYNLSKGEECINIAPPFEKKEKDDTAVDQIIHAIHRQHPRVALGDFTDEPLNHFDEPVRRKKKKENERRYDNSLIIVCGNANLDVFDGTRREELFHMANDMLSQNNTTILFIRGNKDNPEVFNGYLDLSHIKAIPDYSVVMTKESNLLCVGGGISLDRLWVQEQEKRINQFSSKKKKLYFANEAPVLNLDALQEIVDNNITINAVCSHVAPLCVNCENDTDINHWVKIDNSLLKDIQAEREVMQNILNFLNKTKQPLTWWGFGHYGKEISFKDKKRFFCGLGYNKNPKSMVDLISTSSFKDKWNSYGHNSSTISHTIPYIIGRPGF